MLTKIDKKLKLLPDGDDQAYSGILQGGAPTTLGLDDHAGTTIGAR